jgi:predicted MFS family arabinose efflux permease
MRDSLHLGYLLMITGIGAIIGAYLAGYLSDIIKTTQVGILIFLFTLLTMLLTFLAFMINFETITYALVLGFMWGISFNAL